MFAGQLRRRAILESDDFFLKILVRWASEGFSLAVILSVGGAIIEGDLISEAEYYEGISDLVRAKATDVADEDQGHWWEEFRKLLRGIPSMGDEASMRRLEAGEDPEEVLKRRQEMAEAYVHLKNTKILLPNGSFLPLTGGFWRGQRSAVDGFWLGKSSS
jgi:hypothetical protein